MNDAPINKKPRRVLTPEQKYEILKDIEKCGKVEDLSILPQSIKKDLINCI